MHKDIYPDLNEYLTGTSLPEHRFITKKVLEVFRVGVGNQKFRNDNDQLSFYGSIFFPLYSPRSKKYKKDEGANAQLKAKDLKE